MSGKNMNETAMRYIASHRDEILMALMEGLYEPYSPEAATSFRRKVDPFENPIGSTFGRSASIIADGMAAGMPPRAFRQTFDDMIRIRAVQGISPSEVMSFLFAVRKALAAGTAGSGDDSLQASDIAEINEWIDCAIALCMDIYMECRENIFNLKVMELKKFGAAGREMREKRI